MAVSFVAAATASGNGTSTSFTINKLLLVQAARILE